MKIIVYATVLTAILAVTQCFAADICSLGKKTLLLPDTGREEFYKSNMDGRVMEGKGSVVNIWKSGPDNNYTVSVACGNDVVVNVATSSDVSALKAGVQVDFKGTCVSYGSRRYIYSQKTYMVFEMKKGSVSEANRSTRGHENSPPLEKGE